MNMKSMTALLGAALAAGTLAAQPMPPLLSISRVQVRADRMAEYLDIQKKITEAFKKGGAPMRIVMRGAMGNPLEVITVSGMTNYAERDGMNDSAIAKAMTPGEWQALYARRDQCTVSVRTTIERTLPDSSISPAAAPLPAMMREVRTRVRPGKANEYAALVKNELLPALKKTGVTSFRMRQVQYGGSRTEFGSVIPLAKWSELDTMGSALQNAMGAEGYAKYMQKIGEITAWSEYLVWRVVPEASYRNQ